MGILRNKKIKRKAGLADRYAHRGFHDKPGVPENSMAAFRRAVEHGFPSELDVHLIADGSLVVFHDELLERQTSAPGRIEEYDITNLKKLRLEGTDEQIPTFDEVLDLYEDTGLPLLIELKTAGGNHRRLTEAVCRRLDRYKGDFVIESFDPRVLIVLKKLRPDIIRGQLVQDFMVHREDLPFYQACILTNLILAPAGSPDFIAYRQKDKKKLAWRLAEGPAGLAKAVWTVRTPEDYSRALEEGCVPIFETFDPDDK